MVHTHSRRRYIILITMLEDIVRLYTSLAPVIVGGVLTSVVSSYQLFSRLDKPLDGGMVFKDGRRLFGPSKTYRGALSYIILTALCMAIWGLIKNVEPYNMFYTYHQNTLLYDLGVGALLGAAWVAGELPNSFMKRRLSIGQSHQLAGLKKISLIALDQADSIIVVVLVIAIFYPLQITQYCLFVIVGALTHLMFNYLLYIAKLRKNPV